MRKGAELCADNSHTNSVSLTNPGNRYFLTLIQECVSELNSRLSGGIGMARRAMISTSLIPDVDGVWRVSQLTNELQEIVANNLPYFNRVEPINN